MARKTSVLIAVAGFVMLSLTGCSFLQQAADGFGAQALNELAAVGLQGVTQSGEATTLPDTERATQNFWFSNESCIIYGYVEAGNWDMFTVTIESVSNQSASLQRVPLKDLTNDPLFQSCIAS